MVQLSHRVQVFSDGAVAYDTSPSRIYWRVRHDATLWRPNLPEVFPFLPSHTTAMNRNIQLLSKAINPEMSGQKWRSLYGDTTAFTNHQGYGKEDDPRADFVNGLDIGAPYPKQEALVCGGAILTQKYIDGEYLYPEYINGNLPALSVQWVEDNLMCFDAVTVDGGLGGSIIIRRFPQGDGERVRILLLASKPIKIALSNVERVYPPFPSAYRYP